MMCGCESRLGPWDALAPWALDIQLGPTGDFSCHSWDGGKAGKAGKVKRPSPGWQWFGRLSMVHLEIFLRYMAMGSIDHLRNIQWLGISMASQVFWRIFVDTVLFRAYFCQSIFPQGLLSNWKGGSKLRK